MRAVGGVILAIAMLAPGRAPGQAAPRSDTGSPALTPSVRAEVVAAALRGRWNMFGQSVAVELCSVVRAVGPEIDIDSLREAAPSMGVHFYTCDTVARYTGKLATISVAGVQLTRTDSMNLRGQHPAQRVMVRLEVGYPGRGWTEEWVMGRGIEWYVVRVSILGFVDA